MEGNVKAPMIFCLFWKKNKTKKTPQRKKKYKKKISVNQKHWGKNNSFSPELLPVAQSMGRGVT